MPGPIYLPPEVLNAIRAHLTEAVEKARDAYLSANGNEDTLTGQLGFALRATNRSVDVPQGEIPGVWKWSIDYTKFRSHGKGAAEAIVGADGIFEIRIDEPFTNQKSLLFQAKKHWGTDVKLPGQALRLTTWREAACVIDYRPEDFHAYLLDEVIAGRGKRPEAPRRKLDEFLSEEFLACKIGDTYLRYDAPKRTLVWRDMSGRIVATRFKVKHRISVKVTPPKRIYANRIDATIPNSEVHQHRMKVTSEKMVGVSSGNTRKEIRSVKASLNRTYHDDGLRQLDELSRELAKMRIQEMNACLDEISPNSRPKQRAQRSSDDPKSGDGSPGLA